MNKQGEQINCPISFHLGEAQCELLLQTASEYDRMMASLDRYQPRSIIRHWIWYAYNCPKEYWDWTQSDGCTFVNEGHFPYGYKNPTCVMHDFLCDKGKDFGVSRRHADALFLEANLTYEMCAWRAILRFVGVRIGAWWKERKSKARVRHGN